MAFLMLFYFLFLLLLYFIFYERNDLVDDKTFQERIPGCKSVRKFRFTIAKHSFFITKGIKGKFNIK